jgi:hypothetical protein
LNTIKYFKAKYVVHSPNFSRRNTAFDSTYLKEVGGSQQERTKDLFGTLEYLGQPAKAYERGFVPTVVPGCK